MRLRSIGVLRGGGGSFHQESYDDGEDVLETLRARHTVHDICINHDHAVHLGDIPTEYGSIAPHVTGTLSLLGDTTPANTKALRGLGSLGVSIVGTEPGTALLYSHKGMLRHALKDSGIHIPQTILIPAEVQSVGDFAHQHIFRNLPPPWIVRPAVGAWGKGVSIAWTIDELVWAIEKARFVHNLVIVEEYIRGREVAVAWTDKFRDASVYVAPPVSLREDTDSYEISRLLPPSEKHALYDITREVYRRLGLRHYGVFDFIIGRKGPSLIDVNMFPSLATHMPFSSAFSFVGSRLPEMAIHLVELAQVV